MSQPGGERRRANPALLEPALAALAALAESAAAGTGRLLVGIAGPPAAGKSTLATALAEAVPTRLGLAAVAVPMDGFHLPDAELSRLGLADRKGAPGTFDAAGFVCLVRRLRRADPAEVVYAPAFDRVRDASVAAAIPVPPDARVVVIEGNYLLLPVPPWSDLRGLLDLAIYVDAPAESRYRCLVRRHRGRGLDDSSARDWVSRSDEANARLIESCRAGADLVLHRLGPAGTG